MKFGLIGHPIAHSKSPLLFRTAYNGRYTYDLIEGIYFEQSYRKFLKEYHAINITAPFKEEAFERAEVVSGPAALIGAANILVKTEEGITCHNSDFTGIILCIAEELFPGITEEFYATFGSSAHIKIHQFTREKFKEYGTAPRALIIGCGGAGKAAAVAAAEIGCRTTIMNRSTEKVGKFVRGLPEYNFSTAGLEEFKKELKASDIVIYALPAALEDIAALEPDDYNPGQIILEANYRDPSFDAVSMRKLKEGGARYISGRFWLINQAISGYALMTGEAPDVKALLKMEQI